MLSQFFLIFTFILLIGDTSGSREPCRRQWSEFLDGCYAFSRESLTWEEAKQDCKKHRAHLVDIKSKEENNYVGGISTYNISQFWIGVKCTNCRDGKHWWLTTGEAAKYTAWEPQQPNTYFGDESCVRLNPKTLFNDIQVNGWKNLNCNERLPYACKYYRDPCEEGFSYFNGSCYFVEQKLMTWDKARLNCQKKNSVLVDITSQDENTFVTDLTKGVAGIFHIGITDACNERTWLFVDGSKANYINWIPGQPDDFGHKEHCATLQPNNKGLINDWQCIGTFPSVCKYTVVTDED